MHPLEIWHLTADAPRSPLRVSAGDAVSLRVGTRPVGPNQNVEVLLDVERNGLDHFERVVPAVWRENSGDNSYWSAEVGPFQEGDSVSYRVRLSDHAVIRESPRAFFRVGPKIFLALLWHFHQPLYLEGTAATNPVRLALPWVRLHALRDYYTMGAIVGAHPGVHVTFNFTPVLLDQIELYFSGVVDRALELTLLDAASLNHEEQREILSTFFQADFAHQIAIHPRYLELFEKRSRGAGFSVQDVRDLQMWFNLAWFNQLFREGETTLVTGDRASVKRFVEKGRNFTFREINEMVQEQYRILRAIVPLYRSLESGGHVETSTTPHYHPILPLLIDTDQAVIDRPGAVHPKRFSWPEDARFHVSSAMDSHERRFGSRPLGMWPAEGAVSRAVISFFSDSGARWIATDVEVLKRSGAWGYRTDKADISCRAWRAEEADAKVAVFFRDPVLSDAIGFRYSVFENAGEAVDDFIEQVRARFVDRFESDGDRVLTVILDGENAWSTYRQDGVEFLSALYDRLERSSTWLRTVTFGEWLRGNASRGITKHSIDGLERVYELGSGSWIDEPGSNSGVDHGTWIGESEENRAWEVLGEARRFLHERGATPTSHPEAFRALHAAEGSDWFWWYGRDQESDDDAAFDRLFRGHIARIYEEVAAPAPAAVSETILEEHSNP